MGLTISSLIRSVWLRRKDNGDKFAIEDLDAKLEAIRDLRVPALIVSGSGAALDETPIPATDTERHSTLYLQLAGTWVGTVLFEGSNNGTDWVPVNLVEVGTVAGLPVTQATANGIYSGGITARHFRARLSPHTSGSVDAIAVFTPTGGGSGGGGGASIDNDPIDRAERQLGLAGILSPGEQNPNVALDVTGNGHHARLLTSQGAILPPQFIPSPFLAAPPDDLAIGPWAIQFTQIGHSSAGIVYAPELNMLVSFSSDRDTATSDDGGLTWTYRPSAIGTAGSIAGVVWVPSALTFFAICQLLPTPLLKSVDGITWTQVASPPMQLSQSIAHSAGLGLIVVAGYNNNTGQSPGLVSTDDGATWTPMVIQAGIDSAYTLAASDSIFVATGRGNNCFTSSDGLVWTQRSLGTDIDPTRISFFALAYNATMGRFFTIPSRQIPGDALDFRAISRHSADGITWEAGPPSPYEVIFLNAHSDGFFLGTYESNELAEERGILLRYDDLQNPPSNLVVLAPGDNPLDGTTNGTVNPSVSIPGVALIVGEYGSGTIHRAPIIVGPPIAPTGLPFSQAIQFTKRSNHEGNYAIIHDDGRMPFSEAWATDLYARIPTINDGGGAMLFFKMRKTVSPSATLSAHGLYFWCDYLGTIHASFWNGETSHDASSAQGVVSFDEPQFISFRFQQVLSDDAITMVTGYTIYANGVEVVRYNIFPGIADAEFATANAVPSDILIGRSDGWTVVDFDTGKPLYSNMAVDELRVRRVNTASTAPPTVPHSPTADDFLLIHFDSDADNSIFQIKPRREDGHGSRQDLGTFVNLQDGSGRPVTTGQKIAALSLPVVFSSDQPALPVAIAELPAITGEVEVKNDAGSPLAVSPNLLPNSPVNPFSTEDIRLPPLLNADGGLPAHVSNVAVPVSSNILPNGLANPIFVQEVVSPSASPATVLLVSPVSISGTPSVDVSDRDPRRLGLAGILSPSFTVPGPPQITDESGHGFHLYPVGAYQPALVTSPFGAAFDKAVEFTGVDDGENTGRLQRTAADGGAPFGNEVEFNFTDPASGGGPGVANNLIYIGSALEQSKLRFVAKLVTGGPASRLPITYGLFVTFEQSDVSIATAQLQDGAVYPLTVRGLPHHVAATFSQVNQLGSHINTVNLFVDGLLVDSHTYTVVAPVTPSTDLISFGSLAGGLQYAGLMDEVRISGAIRHTAPYAVPTTPFANDGNTIALWHFDSYSAMSRAGQIAPRQEDGHGSDALLPTHVNLAKVGDLPIALGQTDMAGSIPVVFASDQPLLGLDSLGEPDRSAFAEGADLAVPIAGVVNDVVGLGDVPEDSLGALRMTPLRALHANLRDSAGVELGTVASPLNVAAALTANSDPAAAAVVPPTIAILLIPANANRRQLIVRSTSAAGINVYLGHGAAVTLLTAPTLLAPNGIYIEDKYNGAIWGLVNGLVAGAIAYQEDVA